jgi:hypothetical protein
MPSFPLNTAPEPMPTDLDPYQELVWQLNRLPGGAPAAIPDFFGSLLAEAPQANCWRFAQGALELHADGCLWHGDRRIAEFPADLLAAAEAAGIPAMLLGLLALATGLIDGDRRLKAGLPRVDAAAKDLMLMTVCRLCG